MPILVPLTLEVLGETPTGMSVLENSPISLKWLLLGIGAIVLLVFIWRKRDTFIYHQT